MPAAGAADAAAADASRAAVSGPGARSVLPAPQLLQLPCQLVDLRYR